MMTVSETCSLDETNLVLNFPLLLQPPVVTGTERNVAIGKPTTDLKANGPNQNR